MATRTVDVVNCAGGWLFDRAMAGWDVAALVAAHDDVRPLRILGVKALDLELALDGPERWPAALSVSADLYAAEERVRHAVGKAVRRGTAEVTVWGQRRPFELNRNVTSVHHQLSSAARSFKGKALAAAAILAGSVDPVETFVRAQYNPRVAEDSFCLRPLMRPV